MTLGMIFNIQNYSIHDGPGIRTTVFLKGCPLNCLWCHNPESKNVRQEVIYSANKCIGCDECYLSCNNNAIIKGENKLTRDNKKCSLCGICTEKCPTSAMEMIGEEININELMKEIRKDSIFYDQSGGGVTFSGGEPLMQFEFLKLALQRCKDEGIHTVLDTSGYAPWHLLSQISNNVDIFLYDIKHMNDERHIELTGVSNKVILENLEKLSSTGNNIWIRVPIIPTINDDEKNITAIGKLMNKLNLRKIFILPYHNIAMDKYERLGNEYKLSNVQVPSDKHMNEIAQYLKKYGLDVKIGG